MADPVESPATARTGPFGRGSSAHLSSSNADSGEVADGVGDESKLVDDGIAMERAVRPVAVDLVAGFELLQVSAADLAGLQVGDVILTHQSVGRPLVARVGEERLFLFRPAAQDHRLVAEVTGRVEPEDRIEAQSPIEAGDRS